MTDLERMIQRVEVMFTHDSQGRMVALRQRDRVQPAPRFYLGRSRHGNVWRFRTDLEPDSVRALARLASREPGLTPLHGSVPPPPDRIQSFREVLEQSAPIAAEWRGPAFEFPDPLPEPAAGPGRLISHPDEPQPCIALELEERVVSVCHAARRLPGSGAEAGLETLEAHRGCGYAPRVVAAWARRVSEQGESPFYSTSWENRPSRAVARRLGLIPLGEDLHFT